MFAAREYVRLLHAIGPYKAGAVGLVIWMDADRDECVVRFSDGRELTMACSALAGSDEPPSPILAV